MAIRIKDSFHKLRKFSQNIYDKIWQNHTCYYSNGIPTKPPEVNINFSNGRTMKISTGKYADGFSEAMMGGTAVRANVATKPEPSSSSFLPLGVDYLEISASAAQIPKNSLGRDLVPSPKEILTSRLIDRSLRPLFPVGFNYEIQVVCERQSFDWVHGPDILSINAASTTLALSDIPWNGPIAAVKIGLINNEIIINPTTKEQSESQLNLIVTSTKQNLVVMLEGHSSGIHQQDLMKAIKVGVKEGHKIINEITQLQKHYGKTKRKVDLISNTNENDLLKLEDAIRTLSEIRLREIFRDYSHDKYSRDKAVNEVRLNTLEKIKNTFEDQHKIDLTTELFNKLCKQIFRNLIFEDNKRCDGRTTEEIRNISCKANLYPNLHGSALFQRGQTQVQCTVTLGSLESALKMDLLSMLTSGTKEKNFFVNYVFPSYATKETGKVGGRPSRREVGHGALAEKGLHAVIPKDYQFTISLLSQVLESNGSSSMASICGGSLALMDAGVPISSPAAGVAIGLITKFNNNDTKHIIDYKILTDILGIEDYMGDMDFKIAGTKKEITAIQADLKIPGIPMKIIMESIQHGCEAKSKIIDIMNETLNKPTIKNKQDRPVVEKLEILPHKKSKFVGYLKRSREKIEDEGVQINELEENTYTIFAPNQMKMDLTKTLINELLTSEKEPTLKFGGIYTAKIVEIKEIGVMVTLYPGMTPTLLHNSQLDQRKINHPSAIGLEIGQEIQIKYFGRDLTSGLMRLSRRVLQTTSPIVKNYSSKS